MTFTVYVDDNYCYMDEDRRWKLGEFETHQEAVAAAKKLVDDCLLEHYTPGTAADVLYRGYTGFGDDPFITGEGPGIDSKDFLPGNMPNNGVKRYAIQISQKIMMESSRNNKLILTLQQGISKK